MKHSKMAIAICCIWACAGLSGCENVSTTTNFVGQSSGEESSIIQSSENTSSEQVSSRVTSEIAVENPSNSNITSEGQNQFSSNLSSDTSDTALYTEEFDETNAEFDAIHTPLIDYVGEENFVQWLEENKDFSERINIRTFVQHFQINRDDFCTALANETNGVTVDDYYTPEQLDAIFTDDLSQVIEAFDLSFSVEQLEEMENGVSQ